MQLEAESSRQWEEKLCLRTQSPIHMMELRTDQGGVGRIMWGILVPSLDVLSNKHIGLILLFCSCAKCPQH